MGIKMPFYVTCTDIHLLDDGAPLVRIEEGVLMQTGRRFLRLFNTVIIPLYLFVRTIESFSFD